MGHEVHDDDAFLCNVLYTGSNVQFIIYYLYLIYNIVKNLQIISYLQKNFFTAHNFCL